MATWQLGVRSTRARVTCHAVLSHHEAEIRLYYDDESEGRVFLKRIRSANLESLDAHLRQPMPPLSSSLRFPAEAHCHSYVLHPFENVKHQTSRLSLDCPFICSIRSELGLRREIATLIERRERKRKLVCQSTKYLCTHQPRHVDVPRLGKETQSEDSVFDGRARGVSAILPECTGTLETRLQHGSIISSTRSEVLTRCICQLMRDTLKVDVLDPPYIQRRDRPYSDTVTADTGTCVARQQDSTVASAASVAGQSCSLVGGGHLRTITRAPRNHIKAEVRSEVKRAGVRDTHRVARIARHVEDRRVRERDREIDRLARLLRRAAELDVSRCCNDVRTLLHARDLCEEAGLETFHPPDIHGVTYSHRMRLKCMPETRRKLPVGTETAQSIFPESGTQAFAVPCSVIRIADFMHLHSSSVLECRTNTSQIVDICAALMRTRLKSANSVEHKLATDSQLHCIAMDMLRACVQSLGAAPNYESWQAFASIPLNKFTWPWIARFLLNLKTLRSQNLADNDVTSEGCGLGGWKAQPGRDSRDHVTCSLCRARSLFFQASSPHPDRNLNMRGVDHVSRCNSFSLQQIRAERTTVAVLLPHLAGGVSEKYLACAKWDQMLESPKIHSERLCASDARMWCSVYQAVKQLVCACHLALCCHSRRQTSAIIGLRGCLAACGNSSVTGGAHGAPSGKRVVAAFVVLNTISNQTINSEAQHEADFCGKVAVSRTHLRSTRIDTATARTCSNEENEVHALRDEIPTDCIASTHLANPEISISLADNDIFLNIIQSLIEHPEASRLHRLIGSHGLCVYGREMDTKLPSTLDELLRRVSSGMYLNFSPIEIIRDIRFLLAQSQQCCTTGSEEALSSCRLRVIFESLLLRVVTDCFNNRASCSADSLCNICNNRVCSSNVRCRRCDWPIHAGCVTWLEHDTHAFCLNCVACHQRPGPLDGLLGQCFALRNDNRPHLVDGISTDWLNAYFSLLSDMQQVHLSYNGVLSSARAHIHRCLKSLPRVLLTPLDLHTCLPAWLARTEESNMGCGVPCAYTKLPKHGLYNQLDWLKILSSLVDIATTTAELQIMINASNTAQSSGVKGNSCYRVPNRLRPGLHEAEGSSTLKYGHRGPQTLKSRCREEVVRQPEAVSITRGCSEMTCRERHSLLNFPAAVGSCASSDAVLRKEHEINMLVHVIHAAISFIELRGDDSNLRHRLPATACRDYRCSPRMEECGYPLKVKSCAAVSNCKYATAQQDHICTFCGGDFDYMSSTLQVKEVSPQLALCKSRCAFAETAHEFCFDTSHGFVRASLHRSHQAAIASKVSCVRDGVCRRLPLGSTPCGLTLWKFSWHTSALYVYLNSSARDNVKLNKLHSTSTKMNARDLTVYRYSSAPALARLCSQFVATHDVVLHDLYAKVIHAFPEALRLAANSDVSGNARYCSVSCSDSIAALIGGSVYGNEMWASLHGMRPNDDDHAAPCRLSSPSCALLTEETLIRDKGGLRAVRLSAVESSFYSSEVCHVHYSDWNSRFDTWAPLECLLETSGAVFTSSHWLISRQLETQRSFGVCNAQQLNAFQFIDRPLRLSTKATSYLPGLSQGQQVEWEAQANLERLRLALLFVCAAIPRGAMPKVSSCALDLHAQRVHNAVSAIELTELVLGLEDSLDKW
eukprot:CAMPEP_0198668812 /NCGR_PEP_ID=MMETSP1467-20131203/73780_1 /TAXON_ID=1462469 /ORGANISM="unid. sp., Strain CCMP2135" /LENGTH=1649 /DNA_ID=CAMNT_0044405545 /DNA_START=262 /DNA_END=5208 /DNA_ORIENTATION=+